MSIDGEARRAASRRGGKIEWARRQERAERVERFRQALLKQSKAAGNPVKIEQVNLAAQHLEALIRGSNVGCSSGSPIGSPKRRQNLLAMSAATTGLRALLRDLGVGGEPVDPDPHPGKYASDEEVGIGGTSSPN